MILTMSPMPMIPHQARNWMITVSTPWETTVEPVEQPVHAQRTGWVLAMVIGTTVLTGLSMSIMVVTFPAIRADFPDATPAQLSWINNLFTIVSAATLIPCGVLADRLGIDFSYFLSGVEFGGAIDYLWGHYDPSFYTDLNGRQARLSPQPGQSTIATPLGNISVDRVDMGQYRMKIFMKVSF